MHNQPQPPNVSNTSLNIYWTVKFDSHTRATNCISQFALNYILLAFVTRCSHFWALDVGELQIRILVSDLESEIWCLKNSLHLLSKRHFILDTRGNNINFIKYIMSFGVEDGGEHCQTWHFNLLARSMGSMSFSSNHSVTTRNPSRFSFDLWPLYICIPGSYWQLIENIQKTFAVLYSRKASTVNSTWR